MKKKGLENMVNYYMSLKYPFKVEEMSEGGYFVKVIDLPGCMCDADTLEEIPEKLEKAKKAWIEGILERGGTIPLPKADEPYSGRFVVRMPKSLHRRLAECAEQEGVSLNSYVFNLLTYNYERRCVEDWLEELKLMIFSSFNWKLGKAPSIHKPAHPEIELDKQPYKQTG